MANICLYFYLHINKRLRSFNITNLGGEASYFDDQLVNRETQSLVNQGFPLLSQYIQALSSQAPHRPVCGLMFSGGFWEIKANIPMPGWGNIEELIKEQKANLIAQPYYNSLNFLINRDLLQKEVGVMQAKINSLQGYQSGSFFHTDLLYNDFLGYWVKKQGFHTCLAPKVPTSLAQRDMHQLFHPPHCPEVGILIPDQDLAKMIETEDVHTDDLYQHLSNMCINHGLITLGLDLSKLLSSPHKLKKLFYCFNRLQQEGLAQFVSPEGVKNWEKTGGVLSIPTFNSLHDEEETTPWLGNPLQKEAWLALYSKPETFQLFPFLLNSQYFLQMGDQSNGKQHLRAYQQFRSMLTDINLKYSNKSS